MAVDLGFKPHAFQEQINRAGKRFTVTVAHRRFGKTLYAVIHLIHAALETEKENARYAYLAPYLKQAKTVAWDYLRYYAGQVPGVEISEGDVSVDFPNGSRIRLAGGDNPDAIRGIYLDGVVIDELADLRPDVWGSIIRPALADRRGWGFFIGTPKGLNQLHELYQYAISGKDPEWSGLMFRADETGIVDERELASARATMSDAQYRQEFLCDFSASTDNTLITIDLASHAAARSRAEWEEQGSPRVIGVDPARYGDDRTAMVRRWGLTCLEPVSWSGLDNMQVASRVAQEINAWRPDAVFVDAGRGEGVIDRLRSLGYSVVEVNFGAKPMDAHYANKRAEMWDAIRKWLLAGGAIPNDPALKTDLCVPTYSFNAAGRMELEGKDDIKRRGMRSPDLGDALALTFAFPVAAEVLKIPAPRGMLRVQSDYNPFAIKELQE